MIAECSRVSAFSISTQSESVPKYTPKGLYQRWDLCISESDEVIFLLVLWSIGLLKQSNYFQEKTSLGYYTVPQTDTGEQVEYTKAFERTMLKELGKMTP